MKNWKDDDVTNLELTANWSRLLPTNETAHVYLLVMNSKSYNKKCNRYISIMEEC